MLIVLVAFLMTADIDQSLLRTVKAKNGSLVALKLQLYKDRSGSVVQIGLRVVNHGPSEVMLPSLITRRCFLQVDGVPWHSGDIIAELPHLNVYHTGYQRAMPGASIRGEVCMDALLNTRSNMDGKYVLRLTYDDSWSEYPTLGRVPLGSALILKKGDHLSVKLTKMQLQVLEPPERIGLAGEIGL